MNRRSRTEYVISENGARALVFLIILVAASAYFGGVNTTARSVTVAAVTTTGVTVDVFETTTFTSSTISFSVTSVDAHIVTVQPGYISNVTVEGKISLSKPLVGLGGMTWSNVDLGLTHQATLKGMSYTVVLENTGRWEVTLSLTPIGTCKVGGVLLDASPTSTFEEDFVC